MKLTDPNVLYALSACFASALAGVGYVYLDGLGATIIAPLAFTTALVTLRLSWQNRDDIAALNKSAESMAISGLILLLPSILLMGLLPALLIFLVFAQLALNLQLTEHKHVHYGLLVSFIFLIMGAAEAITGYYLVFMTVFATAAAVCLSLLNSDRPGTKPAPFQTLPNVRLILSLISLAVVIYLAIPRPPAANLGSQYSIAAKYYRDSDWGDEADNGGSVHDPGGDGSARDASHNAPSDQHSEFHYRGFDQSFDILANDQSTRVGNALLALMSASHGAYLKVESFDRFDGLRWHKSRDEQTRRKLEDLVLELDRGREPNFQQTITLVNTLGPYIPAASIPLKLHFPADSIEQDAYQNLKLPARLQQDIVYTVESLVSYQQQRPFAGTGVPPTASDLSLYQGFDERIADLAAQVTQAASDDMSKALLLETYLKENHRYDANSIFSSQQRTPLDRFLFETRSGHCEFFASALAVMLRSQGIPSRLVTGFSATTMNPLTGYYEIYSLDGHAWVEAWIEGKGWLLLEATPPYQLPDAETESMTARQIQNYVEALGKYAALGDNDPPSLAEIWTAIATQFNNVLRYLRQLAAHYLDEMTILAALLLAGGLLYRIFKKDILAWRLYWRVKCYRQKGTVQDTLFYMQQLHRLLRLRGLPRHPGDSIESFCFHPAFRGYDPARLDALSKQINRHFYNDGQYRPDEELFRGAFFHIFSSSK